MTQAEMFYAVSDHARNGQSMPWLLICWLLQMTMQKRKWKHNLHQENGMILTGIFLFYGSQIPEMGERIWKHARTADHWFLQKNMWKGKWDCIWEKLKNPNNNIFTLFPFTASDQEQFGGSLITQLQILLQRNLQVEESVFKWWVTSWLWGNFFYCLMLNLGIRAM